MQNPVLVLVRQALDARHHLPDLTVSPTKLSISFFLLSFFSLIFSSRSFIPLFFTCAGTEPPNLLPLFYLLALTTPPNPLLSSSSLTYLCPHRDKAWSSIWLSVPFPSIEKSCVMWLSRQGVATLSLFHKSIAVSLKHPISISGKTTRIRRDEIAKDSRVLLRAYCDLFLWNDVERDYAVHCSSFGE